MTDLMGCIHECSSQPQSINAPVTLPVTKDKMCDDKHLSTRRGLYKVKDHTVNQEERRRRLLESQKKEREKNFNKCRNIVSAGENDDEEDEMQTAGDIPVQQTQRTPRKYANTLMLSEWMQEVPSDLPSSWYFLFCPVGKRCLVVADRHSTKVFSKSGIRLTTFPSLLPGGSHLSSPQHCTVLDCVWSSSSSTYYILDVLAWRNQPLVDCETEFRFYWLRSQLTELEGISVTGQYNRHPFVPLPFGACNSEEMEKASCGPPMFPEEVDGILFYHREAHYTSGPCPLVGWLLPFMLPEVLGVPVSEALTAKQPEDYPGHLEFISNYKPKDPKQKKKERNMRRAARRAAANDSMEVTPDAQTSELEDTI